MIKSADRDISSDYNLTQKEDIHGYFAKTYVYHKDWDPQKNLSRIIYQYFNVGYFIMHCVIGNTDSPELLSKTKSEIIRVE